MAGGLFEATLNAIQRALIGNVKYLLIISCLLGTISARAQFYAGDGDGYGTDGSPLSQINSSVSYCSAGNGDGYGSGFSGLEMNMQAFYCSGDSSDGYHGQSSGLSIANQQQFYCSGSTMDGYDASSSGLVLPNQQSFYCSSGDSDGYDLANSAFLTLNSQAGYCAAGNRDGYASLTSGLVPNFYQSIYCNAGFGDGYHHGLDTASILGVGIWKGIASMNWFASANWEHDSIPDIQHNVLIPPGCPHYPLIVDSLGIDTLIGTIQCHGLDILQGGALYSAERLFINGHMNIYGNYISTINKNISQKVCENGTLNIFETATVKLGNMSSSPGRADLVIQSGGTFNMLGGTLEIDDQFMVESGATFLMTGGEVFTHKYGDGTPFNAFNRGNFYVESGAFGQVNGGILKICGRPSENGFHAFNILEPGFDFTGTSTIRFIHGDNPVHYDATINTVDGVKIKNLEVLKEGKTVFIGSNLTIIGAVNIKSTSVLQIESGNTVSISP
jgi:hypothetical protein